MYHPNDYEQAVTRWRRTVRRIEMDAATCATVFTLNCGHQITHEIASHPITVVKSILIDIGDEVECDRCRVACREAAPDLLIALKSLRRIADPLFDKYRAQLDIADAAIAKAEDR